MSPPAYLCHFLFHPFLSVFTFCFVFFTLISFFSLLDLIPSYFLSPPSPLPSFSFSCLTQEAVISKRSVLADIFHGTSLISTRRVAIGQHELPPFPTNPPEPGSQPASRPQGQPASNSFLYSAAFVFALYLSPPRLHASLQAGERREKKNGMDEGEGLRSKTEVYKAHNNGSQAVVQGLPQGPYMGTEWPRAKRGIFPFAAF